MRQVSESDLPAGEVVDPTYVRVRPYAYYDRLVVPAGEMMPESFPLFCQPIASNRPGSWDFKTRRDTNMQLSGCLPPPCELLLQRVAFVKSPGTDISQLASSHTFSLQILNKIFLKGPVVFPGFQDIEESLLEEFFIAGSSDFPYQRTPRAFRAPYDLSLHPYRLVSLMYFSLKLEGKPFVSPGIDLLVFLDGRGTFAVQ